VGRVSQIWINWTVTAFMVSSVFEMRSVRRRLERLEDANNWPRRRP
jgi:hypothetical protein